MASNHTGWGPLPREVCITHYYLPLNYHHTKHTGSTCRNKDSSLPCSDFSEFPGGAIKWSNKTRTLKKDSNFRTRTKLDPKPSSEHSDHDFAEK